MGNFVRQFKSTFSSQKKVWTQLAHDIKAEYIDNGFFKAHIITKSYEWGSIKLDSFNKRRGNNSVTFTRFQADCSNPKKIEFIIKRSNFFNKKAPKGLEFTLTDYSEFDRKFRLFVSNKREIKQVLDRKIIRNIVEQQPFNDIKIDLKENNLELHISSLNKDIEQLKSLFILMESLHNQIDFDI